MLGKLPTTLLSRFVPGSLDVLNDGVLAGWVKKDNTTRVKVIEIVYDGKILSEARCDLFRSDLAELGFKHPDCGFELIVDAHSILDLNRVAVHIDGISHDRFTRKFKQLIIGIVNKRPADTASLQDQINRRNKEDIEWLQKTLREKELDLSYYKSRINLMEELFPLIEGSDVSLRRIQKETSIIKARVNQLSDDLEFERVISSPMSYSQKKAAFSHLAIKFLERDLDSIRLQFPHFEEPVVSIVLVLYNKAELTYQCLKSILGLVTLPYEVIVIDNASVDKSAALFEKITGVRYIRNEENLGFLKACNQAVKVALGDYILLLNNDSVVKKDAIENAVACYECNELTGVVGAKIMQIDGMLQEAGSIIWKDGSCLGYGRREQPNEAVFNYRRQVDYVSGAFFLVKKSIWEELGGFDEAFAPCYYEETDFCIRASQAGYQILYEPESEIVHFEFGSEPAHGFAKEQMQKNQKIIQEKHSDFLFNQFEAKEENIIAAAHKSRRKKIIYMDDKVPYDNMGAGFPRARKIIQQLKKYGEVIIYPCCPSEVDYSDPLFKDLMVLDSPKEVATKFFVALAMEVDFIWISRPHNFSKYFNYGWHTALKKKVVYDAEALFSEREKMRKEIFGEAIDIDCQALALEESSLLKKADVVVSVSEIEKRKIQEKNNDLRVFCAGHPMDQESREYLAYPESNEILFVGNLEGTREQSPNVDSIDFFLSVYRDELIEKDLKLVLVGRISEENCEKWSLEGVTIVGPVGSLDEYFASALCTIAPTRYAAGIAHKVHESLSRGVPVFATKPILEQCSIPPLQKNGLLTKDFVEQLITLNHNDFKKLFELQIRYCSDDMSEIRFNDAIQNACKAVIEH